MLRGIPRDVVVNAQNCGNVVSELELQPLYSVYFQTNTTGKDMYLFIPIAMSWIVPLHNSLS